MSNFIDQKIGDTSLYVSDGNYSSKYPKSSEFLEEGVPFLSAYNIEDGRIVDYNTKYISEEHHQRLRKGHLRAGDVLIVTRGSLGKVARVSQEYDGSNINAQLVLLRSVDNVINQRFLYYMISAPAFVSQIVQAASGAAQPQLPIKQLNKLLIRYPVKHDIQEKIASVLSAYDDLIENNRRRIQLLEQFARLLYKDWFVHLRFPGHEHVKIKDGVPEGWEKKPLSEIADITMGQSPKSEFYNENGYGIPFHQGVTNFGTRFPSHKTYCTVKGRLAEPGDILFSVRAPVGRINITPDKIVVGRGLAAIRSNQGQHNFLFYALKAHFFKEDMIGGGAIYAAITKKDLYDVELFQPVNSIVDTFVDYVKPIDAQIDALHRAVNHLSKARDLLLPRLMNGGVNV